MTEEDKRKPYAGDYYDLGLYYMYEDDPKWYLASKFFDLAVKDSEANNKFGVPSRYYHHRGVARIKWGKFVDEKVCKRLYIIKEYKYEEDRLADKKLLKEAQESMEQGKQDLEKARELQDEKRQYKIETLRDFLICRDEEHDTIITDDDYDSLDLCDDILRAKPEDVKTLTLKMRLLARDDYSSVTKDNLVKLVEQLEYLVKINRERLQRLLEKKKDWVYEHRDLSKDLNLIKIEEDKGDG